MDLSSARFRWTRRVVGVVTVIGGMSATSGALALMQHAAAEVAAKPAPKVVSFEVPTSSKPPPRSATTRPQQQAKRSSAKAAPRPAAAFASGLSGMDFGLPGLSGALDEATSALVGDAGPSVMTEDAVDTPPRPTARVPAEYPARARAQGVTGFVTLSLLVGPDGSVQDARVLEAQPAGVFDAAALDAVRRWRFDPATYQGSAVAVRARQTLRFELE